MRYGRGISLEPRGDYQKTFSLRVTRDTYVSVLVTVYLGLSANKAVLTGRRSVCPRTTYRSESCEEEDSEGFFQDDIDGASQDIGLARTTAR